MKQIIEDLKAVDKQLGNEGFAQNTFVRRTLLNSIDALSQHDGKPIVSGSLPPFPDDERIAVESITQGSKEVGLGAISQVYFRKGAKWMRGQLGGNDR